MFTGKINWKGDWNCWRLYCYIGCSGKGSLSAIWKGEGIQPCERLQEKHFQKREQHVQRPEAGICLVYSRKSSEATEGEHRL